MAKKGKGVLAGARRLAKYELLCAKRGLKDLKRK